MDIKSYEIDSVIETLQKMGLKGLMEYTDVFVINHLLEQNTPIKPHLRPIYRVVQRPPLVLFAFIKY